MPIPQARRWLFWEVDPAKVDPVRHADFVIPRVLEHGALADVRWLLRRLGPERIHRFLRERSHPELSAKTLAFWRVYFDAEDESWPAPPAFRKHSSLPWPG
jgi:hypothetical protein